MSDPLNHQHIQRLKILIPRSLDGVVSRDEAKELEDVLKSDAKARAFYRMYLSIHCDLESVVNTDPQTTQEVMNSDSGFNTQFWDALAKYEKKAPTLVLPDKKPKKELIEKVVYPPRQKRKVSKFNIIFLGLNAAAMLFLVLFLKFAPPKQDIEVATLSDSINAKWADMDVPTQVGIRLAANSDKLMLREGLAEITFDDQTKAVIEAPAEFQILAEDRIGLIYGKIYARVSPDAVGFSVYTSSAKVIDMGTEFGVRAEFDGDTQLHVLKGKTMLIAVEAGKINVEVTEGMAKKVSNSTGEISDIGCRTDYFVRDISSESNLVWKGQKAIDLTDMIGGGNGTGTGRANTGIRWEDGAFVSTQKYYIGERLQGTTNFIPVPGSLFIEGVFVPNSTNGPIQIARDAMVRWDVPDTPGQYCYNIHNSGTISRGSGRIPGHTQILDGQLCGTPQNPVISMHANAGVTFNLNQIRRYYNDFSLDSFTAVCGYSETFFEYPVKVDPGLIPQASFFVLVDGQPRFSKINMTPNDTACRVQVELTPDDTYLTLAVTGGGDQKVSYDWCLFARPQINIE